MIDIHINLITVVDVYDSQDRLYVASEARN